VRKRFPVIAFEQGQLGGDKPQMIQRICVRRGRPGLLP
jgi:hypothetical protein